MKKESELSMDSQENKKSKMEIFMEILEKHLLRNVKSGRITAEEAAEKKRYLIAHFAEAKIPDDCNDYDLDDIAFIIASPEARHDDRPPAEEIYIDTSKYWKIAQRLEEKYKDQLWTDGEETHVGFSKRTIEGVLHQFSDEVLKHYFGHGVARNHNLEAALSILENHIFFGNAAPLVTKGLPSAYTHGDFLILSHRDKYLDKIDGVVVKMDGGKTKRAAKVDSDVVFVCNLSFDSLVDDLRKMFPNEKILHAYELADYIKEEEKKANSQPHAKSI